MLFFTLVHASIKIIVFMAKKKKKKEIDKNEILRLFKQVKDLYKSAFGAIEDPTIKNFLILCNKLVKRKIKYKDRDLQDCSERIKYIIDSKIYPAVFQPRFDDPTRAESLRPPLSLPRPAYRSRQSGEVLGFAVMSNRIAMEYLQREYLLPPEDRRWRANQRRSRGARVAR